MSIARLQPEDRLSGALIHENAVHQTHRAGQGADDPNRDVEGQTADVLRQMDALLTEAATATASRPATA